ncbi:MAG: type II toxin-antitoxin system RelE/ParE family toxin [Lachnospiraceae bacterium]|nr:type II toxin-antitoxin system RelE/ParE family toxin [Lachnospiraceae bacterium]
MKKLDMSPEALMDLQSRKAWLAGEFGEKISESIIGQIMDSIGNLLIFPDSGVSLYARYGIECDYFYIVSKKNYIFFRQEEESIKIIRVLDERQDFMDTLFHIRTTTQETEDYWGE